MIFGEKNVLRTEIRILENEINRLRDENSLLKSDYARLVEHVSNIAMGKALQPKWDLGNQDPYAEDTKLKDEWMTPGEEELPDIRKVEEELTPSAS